MKKALVMTFVLVLGLGLTVFAAGEFTGKWDAKVSLWPAASEFSDFVKSLTSGVDVDFTIAGFTFGMESTFGLAGMTGMDFDIDGVLGAFTVSADIDFSPMVLTSYAVHPVTLVYFDEPKYECNQSPSWLVKNEIDNSVYTAAFDDLTAEVSVSIAGVNLGALGYLKGDAGTTSVTYGTWYFEGKPGYISWNEQGVNPNLGVQSDSKTVTVADCYGSGWRLSMSGSFGGATLTGRAYFNIEDYWGSLYGLYSTYSLYPCCATFADMFVESGDWAIVCCDCIARFTELDIIVEDVSFGCATFSGMVTFDCCGFGDVVFLVEDIGLGCCWDLGFDLLITFDETTKSLDICPDITLANTCFTIEACVLTSDPLDETKFEITGIDIYGLTFEWALNGVTFKSVTSFDLGKKPILGSAAYGGRISSPDKIYVWQPDTTLTEATFSYDHDADTCTVSDIKYPINTTDGSGLYELTSFSCERAYPWESFVIDVDGDSCCGGAFDISAAFYFGDVKKLTDLDGWYVYDLRTATGAANASYGKFLFYGDDTTFPSDLLGTISAWSGAGCDCCPCDDCSFGLDSVIWDAEYTAKAANRLFDWLRTDLDVKLGVGSGFVLTFGADVSLWGWDDLTAGFEFTF